MLYGCSGSKAKSVQVSKWSCRVAPAHTAAEEAPHRQRHRDHRVPGARRSPLHPEGRPLSLSARLHHRTGARPLF